MTRRLTLAFGLLVLSGLRAADEPANSLRFALHSEPKTFDPFLAADESAEAVKYLTEGVLIRINRLTQRPEPELAASWKVTNGGKRVVFQLRSGVRFPDGSALTSKDVVETFRKLFDPALHSPIADTFKSENGTATISAEDDHTVLADFPAPPPAFENLFDQVAIVSSRATERPAPGLGPFLIAERKPGAAILLKRNPAYWKRQADGKPLPRLDSIQLEIQQNRDLELVRFRRGELHLIDNLTPDLYERLKEDASGTFVDSGPTLGTEFLWFNLAPAAPIAEYKKEWFRSVAFRRAVSEAIHREDLGRVVYRGHASAAAGLVSPTNKQWFNEKLRPEQLDLSAAQKRLADAGFREEGGVLRDRGGNTVEFSIATNAGSKTRERMAALIQQDLAKLGIKINVVTFEFPSLIERMTRTLNYEMCLLGLVNVEADPNGLMNVMLSSATNHPWNPAQKTPGSDWEAEIDRLMLAQAATADYRARKKSFDRVQEILRDQAPILYLLHPNALSAVSTQVAGVKPTPFFPRTFWDAEHLTLTNARGR